MNVWKYNTLRSKDLFLMKTVSSAWLIFLLKAILCEDLLYFLTIVGGKIVVLKWLGLGGTLDGLPLGERWDFSQAGHLYSSFSPSETSLGQPGRKDVMTLLIRRDARVTGKQAWYQLPGYHLIHFVLKIFSGESAEFVPHLATDNWWGHGTAEDISLWVILAQVGGEGTLLLMSHRHRPFYHRGLTSPHNCWIHLTDAHAGLGGHVIAEVALLLSVLCCQEVSLCKDRLFIPLHWQRHLSLGKEERWQNLSLKTLTFPDLTDCQVPSLPISSLFPLLFLS